MQIECNRFRCVQSVSIKVNYWDRSQDGAPGQANLRFPCMEGCHPSSSRAVSAMWSWHIVQWWLDILHLWSERLDSFCIVSKRQIMVIYIDFFRFFISILKSETFCIPRSEWKPDRAIEIYHDRITWWQDSFSIFVPEWDYALWNSFHLEELCCWKGICCKILAPRHTEP